MENKYQPKLPTTDDRMSERIKEERKRKGLTVLQLANILKVNQSSVSRWERGVIKRISPKLVWDMSKLFGVSFEYMIGMNVPRNPESNKTGELYEEYSVIGTRMTDAQLRATIKFAKELIKKPEESEEEKEE